MDAHGQLSEPGEPSQTGRPAAASSYWRSLRGRLSIAFMIVFVAVVALGVISAWSVKSSNQVSTEVRDRWLPNTRFLGDLNNYTSDYQTAEAESLSAADAEQTGQSLRDINTLDDEVSAAQRGYEAIHHNAEEAAVYRAFVDAWTEYKRLAGQVAQLAAAGDKSHAIALYRSQSRTVYQRASDLLGRLTDYNQAQAAEASKRSALAYERARRLIFAALTATGALLVAVVIEVRRSISTPLLDLATAMRRLAASDTGVEIGHVDRLDEIGEMARAMLVFRGNSIDLAQSQHGLAQQASMLEEKVAHEQQLARVHRTFVATIAHEFRTPLTQIDAQAQRLANLKDRLDPADLVERAHRMRSSVAQIVRLIDDLINASRMLESNPTLYYHPQPLDLIAVLQEVCQVHREISRDALIVEDLGTAPLPMLGDPALLFQAFSNLLSNAIKYSTGYRRVQVSAHPEECAISVCVRDWGIGIPEADLNRVFDQYFRGSNVASIVGTGIGLKTVATIVKLHGGSVRVEQVEGGGTMLVTRLPFGVAAENHPPALTS